MTFRCLACRYVGPTRSHNAHGTAEVCDGYVEDEHGAIQQKYISPPYSLDKDLTVDVLSTKEPKTP